jgi:hypothetical protein
VSDEKKPWYVEYRPLIAWAVVTVVMSIAGAIGGWEAKPVLPPVVVEVPVPAPVAAEPAPTEFSPVGGWVRDPDEIAANLDDRRTLHFHQTPAGKAALGDEDVYLWRGVRKVNNRGPPWYPNTNQGSVGSCVGCGWAHSCDVVQASAITISGANFEWKQTSPEAIYAGSRVEVGGGRISGDGSVGSWAAKWCRERGGLISVEKVGPYSATRARDWGRKGVPDELEADAKTHPVKGCALVTSWTDVKRAVAQGYPVPVCSDRGFSMQRDATGQARPQGNWNHCMAIIGIRAARDGRSEAGFVLNSWGDAAHTGPVWPEDAPVAGFWADANTIDRMVRQGDSFALSDVAGFPGRKIPDWFIRNRPARPRFDPFAERFALAY